MGAAQEKGREAKHKASDAADRAMGMGHDAGEAAKDRAYRAKDAASGAAGRARDIASDAAGAAEDRARDGAQQTGSYVAQTAEAARQKAAGAALYAKDTVVASKDKTGALLQQVRCTVGRGYLWMYYVIECAADLQVFVLIFLSFLMQETRIQ
jgi:hypothetical protein